MSSNKFIMKKLEVNVNEDENVWERERERATNNLFVKWNKQIKRGRFRQKKHEKSVT